jgi:hypothetical protein
VTLRRSYAILDATGKVPEEFLPSSPASAPAAHPDLAEHQTLGLAPAHAHPYSGTAHNHDAAYSATAHIHPVGAPVHVTLANGATAMGFGTNGSVKVTPTANATYTTTVPVAGTRCTLLVLTSGTTSRTITFGTGFKAVGTLATGTVTARVFAVSFISDGTNLYETGRTAAMVA